MVIRLPGPDSVSVQSWRIYMTKMRSHCSSLTFFFSFINWMSLSNSLWYGFKCYVHDMHSNASMELNLSPTKPSTPGWLCLCIYTIYIHSSVSARLDHQQLEICHHLQSSVLCIWLVDMHYVANDKWKEWLDLQIGEHIGMWDIKK